VKPPGKTLLETGQDVKIFSRKQMVIECEEERDGADLCGHVLKLPLE
jgi:hypothetical protein